MSCSCHLGWTLHVEIDIECQIFGFVIFFNCGRVLQFGAYSRLNSKEIIFSALYRHSLIYAVNVGTHKKTRRSKNRVNRGYLVVLKGRKIG